MSLTKHRLHFKILLFTPLLIFAAIFLMLLLNKKQEISADNVSSLHLSLAPKPTTVPEDSGIPINDNTLSYARVKNDIYLRYNGVVFNQDGPDHNPVKLSLPNWESYHWVGIVDGPDLKGNTVPLDDVFSFKIMPGASNFLFVTQWDRWLSASGSAGQEYHIFAYDPTKSENKLTSIYSSTISGQTEFVAPKIDQISSSGNYVSFSFFKCWGCQESVPQTILWNRQDNSTKNIGRVTDFEWLNNGGYQYKTYTPTPCEQPEPAECSQDPNTLQLQIGQY